MWGKFTSTVSFINLTMSDGLLEVFGLALVQCKAESCRSDAPWVMMVDSIIKLVAWLVCFLCI